jgi:hypothetical protein
MRTLIGEANYGLGILGNNAHVAVKQGSSLPDISRLAMQCSALRHKITPRVTTSPITKERKDEREGPTRTLEHKAFPDY